MNRSLRLLSSVLLLLGLPLAAQDFPGGGELERMGQKVKEALQEAAGLKPKKIVCDAAPGRKALEDLDESDDWWTFGETGLHSSSGDGLYNIDVTNPQKNAKKPFSVPLSKRELKVFMQAFGVLRPIDLKGKRFRVKARDAVLAADLCARMLAAEGNYAPPSAEKVLENLAGAWADMAAPSYDDEGDPHFLDADETTVADTLGLSFLPNRAPNLRRLDPKWFSDMQARVRRLSSGRRRLEFSGYPPDDFPPIAELEVLEDFTGESGVKMAHVLRFYFHPYKDDVQTTDWPRRDDVVEPETVLDAAAQSLARLEEPDLSNIPQRFVREAFDLAFTTSLTTSTPGHFTVDEGWYDYLRDQVSKASTGTVHMNWLRDLEPKDGKKWAAFELREGGDLVYLGKKNGVPAYASGEARGRIILTPEDKRPLRLVREY